MGFKVNGLKEYELSMKGLETMPKEVQLSILSAGADVLVKALKRKIEALGLVKTGKLRDSIKAFPKIGRNGPHYLVYPYGKRGERRRRLVTKAYKRSKHGRTYTVGGDTVDVTNNEVGFIYEFGAQQRHIPAMQWMSTTVEATADAVEAAEAAVYDNYLKSLNL